jgi:uncharacterized membrane protein
MSMSHLTLEPILPLWLLIVLLCAALAGVVFQFRSIRKRLGLRKALAISFLRLAAFWCLILFSLNVSLVKRTEHKVAPNIAVILDTSRSMSLPGHGGKGSRLDEAKGFLTGGAQPMSKSLSEAYDARFYALGESLRQIEVSELPGLRGGGSGVDLNEALKALAGRASLVLFLSDGTMDAAGSLPTGIPVVTIPLGDEGAYRDLLIESVKFPPLVFRGREATIDVTIRSRGYKNTTVPVLLKQGSKLLTTKSIQIGSTPGNVTASLVFRPDAIGTHNLSISIPPQVGESLANNNAADISIKVVRDVIRILMVSGSPSPSYRFMRMALKNDPSVDLLSFVILRKPSNVINVPLQEQSLIPFPVDTLFSKDLKDFDLLIFDNLPFHLYVSEKHLEAIREFVRGGGGFAMIGGPNLSDQKRLASSPLGEIIPLGLAAEEDYSRELPSGVRLTPAGVTHPLTRLSSDGAYNLKTWQEMAPLEGFNLLKAKRAGAVLLETAKGPARPLVAVGSYGKGRAMVLATDYSWKWNAGMVARGKDNWAYLRFVERMVRWLTKDPALDPVMISLPERPGESGRELQVKIKVGEDQAGSRETVLFSVFSPEGFKVASGLKAAGQTGEFLGLFRPEKKGTYRMRVETRNGSLEETIVIGEGMQGFDGAPNHELLRTIASSTGGKALPLDADVLKEIKGYAEKGARRLIEEKQVPLWGLPIVLALIVAFLTLEWYLRRRWGLA